MDDLRNIPALRLGRGLLEITSATFDELADLHLTTCVKFAERNVDSVTAIFKADGIADFVDHQRRQYQALWSDREDYLGSASAIIRRAVKQANELWANPAHPPAAVQAQSVATPPVEVVTVHEPVFELFEDQSGEHRFRLIGCGGTELLTSQAYKSCKGARKGVEVMRRNACNDDRYERIETDSGLPMFNLKAGNHQIIGTSLPYQSAAAMEDDLATVKTASATARVVEP